MLDRVVARCFEKDPDSRWQSAADLLPVLKWVGDVLRLLLRLPRVDHLAHLTAFVCGSRS